jgi:quinol monooxygenase YgiN
MTVWRHYVISAAPGKEDAMVDALKLLASKVRPLAGCEGIEWGRDAENPADFVFIEAWTSADAHKAASSQLTKDDFGPMVAALGAPPAGRYVTVSGKI